MLRTPNRTPQNYKEKFSKHDFFKKRGQNILKLTDSVEKGQNFWNLGVSIGETFFGLTVPSQTMCVLCTTYLHKFFHFFELYLE